MSFRRIETKNFQTNNMSISDLVDSAIGDEEPQRGEVVGIHIGEDVLSEAINRSYGINHAVAYIDHRFKGYKTVVAKSDNKETTEDVKSLFVTAQKDIETGRSLSSVKERHPLSDVYESLQELPVGYVGVFDGEDNRYSVAVVGPRGANNTGCVYIVNKVDMSTPKVEEKQGILSGLYKRASMLFGSSKAMERESQL